MNWENVDLEASVTSTNIYFCAYNVPGIVLCQEHLSSFIRKDYIVHCSFIKESCTWCSWGIYCCISPTISLGEWGSESDPAPLPPLCLTCEQLALNLIPKCWPGEIRGPLRTALALNNVKQTGPQCDVRAFEMNDGCGFSTVRPTWERDLLEGRGLCGQWPSELGLTSSKPAGVCPELAVRGALSAFHWSFVSLFQTVLCWNCLSKAQ